MGDMVLAKCSRHGDEALPQKLLRLIISSSQKHLPERSNPVRRSQQVFGTLTIIFENPKQAQKDHNGMKC